MPRQAWSTVASAGADSRHRDGKILILAATFRSSEKSFTLPIALQRFVGEFDTAWGAFAAGSMVVSLPVVALFYALQKRMVGGLSAGGVKG